MTAAITPARTGHVSARSIRSTGPRSLAPLILCLTLPALASCRPDRPSPLEPEAVAGSYALVTIDGDSLPVAGVDALYEYEVLSGSLQIGLGGELEQSLTRSEKLGLYPPEIRTYTSVHPYRLGTRSIIIEYGGGDAIGTVDGGRISVRISVGTPVTRVYERVP